MGERDVGADLRLDADVGRRAAEDAAGDLEGVAEVDPLVGPHRVVAEVEVGDELGERENDGPEGRVEGLDVGERVLDLDVVVQGDVELLPERAVHADGHLDLAVADDGRRAGGVHLDEEREDVELRADEAGRARLEEARLLELASSATPRGGA